MGLPGGTSLPGLPGDGHMNPRSHPGRSAAGGLAIVAVRVE
jgi:hypothetical protein